ncbi:MAG: DegV family protein [Caldilineales bacterium]|nr:DegV family protein [Caldilineales bacterium]
MKPVRIVTDSSAHLTQEEIEQLHISVVPMQVRIGRRLYKEGVDLTTKTYERHLAGVKTLPSTQPPVLQDLIDVYQRLSKETDQVLSLHISRELSPTYQLAHTAAAALRGYTQITVLDSETISRGLGMIVKCAAEAAANGASLNEVSRLVRGLIPTTFFSFFIDDLSYPKRDERIRASQAILGTMFGIKPLMEIREGNLIVMEKVRNQFDVVEKLFTFISEFAYLEEIALLQYGNDQDATLLLERLEASYPDLPVFTDAYSPTLATFIGPTALGVIVRETI